MDDTLPKPQMQPSEPKKEEAEKTLKAPALRARTDLDDPLRLTPEDRVRKALGLGPKDPIPQPTQLSPQQQRAIDQLDAASAHQVMAVMGGLQHLEEKAKATGEEVRAKMGASTKRITDISFAQRTVIRRFEKGTLDQDDIARARGMIASAGASGAIDTKDIGLDALVFQREEMLGAAKDIQSILHQQMPKGEDLVLEARILAFVDDTISEQVANTSTVVDQSLYQHKNSDLDRIALILEAQDKVGKEGLVQKHTSTLG